MEYWYVAQHKWTQEQMEEVNHKTTNETLNSDMKCLEGVSPLGKEIDLKLQVWGKKNGKIRAEDYLGITK